MLKILVVLYMLASVLVLFGLCSAAARVLPRPNRRGGRLGRWLQFHGSLR